MNIKPIRLYNKKAQSILDLFLFIAIIFIVLLFFGIWKYGFNEVTTVITSIDEGQTFDISTEKNNTINISKIGDDTFGNVNIGLNALEFVGFAIIIGMILSILITSFMVKSHPVFLIVYIFIIILAVIVSIPVSNSYESFLTDDTFGVVLSGYGASSFIMTHLPIWVTIIGFIGAILLFSGTLRDRGQGGGL